MIINPWIFYVIDILGALEWFCIFICITAMICIFVATFIIYNVDFFVDTNEESNNVVNKCIKYIKKLVCVIIASALLIVMIPQKQTMYTMLVSSYVTTDNVEIATNVIKDSVDYIFEKLDGEE